MKLFGDRAITRDLIETISAPEASILLLGLQHYWREVTISDDLELLDLAVLAQRCAGSEEYKRLLIVCATRDILSDGQPVDEFVRNAKITHVHPSSEEADLKFFERLRPASAERLYIFSTTSQITSFFSASFSAARPHRPSSPFSRVPIDSFRRRHQRSCTGV